MTTPKARSNLRALFTNSVVYGVGDALNKGLAFLLIPLYARELSPSDYGVLAVCSTLGALLSIAALEPLDGAAARHFFDSADPHHRRDVYFTAWVLLLTAGGVVCALAEVLGGSGLVPVVAGVAYVPYVRYVVWTVFLTNGFVLLLRSWFVVHEKALAHGLANAGLFTLQLALILYFVRGLHTGAAGNLRAVLLGAAGFAVLSGLYLARAIGGRFRSVIARELLGFALPLVPHLVCFWVLGLSDRLILERFVGLDDVGVYTLGYQAGQALSLVAIAMGNALAPYYFRTASEPDGAAKLARVGAHYVAALAACALALAVLAGPAIRLFARPEYAAAEAIVPWIALAYFFRGVYFLFSSALSHARRTAVLPAITGAAAALNIGANLFLVPRFGYWAAVYSTLATFVLHTAWVSWVSQKILPVPYPYARLFRLAVGFTAVYALAMLIRSADALETLVLRAAVLAVVPALLWAAGLLPLPARAGRAA